MLPCSAGAMTHSVAGAGAGALAVPHRCGVFAVGRVAQELHDESLVEAALLADGHLTPELRLAVHQLHSHRPETREGAGQATALSKGAGGPANRGMVVTMQ